MSKELIISSSRHETRVAIMEDDQLVEIYFQRANEYSLAGSIHKGRVTRVLPGMQSAFVDLGLDRDTFLYVSDFFEENGDEYDRIETKPTKPSQAPPRSEPAQIQAPIVEAEELAAPDESAKEVAAAPESAERTEEPASGQAAGGQDQRDKRGRRGRRRRTRGRGFPDSKYASDLTSAPAPEEKAIPADDEGEGTVAEEVFLLPGESLAKYSSRSASGSDSEQIEPVDRQPDDPDSPIEQRFTEEALEEERFEAGQIDLVEPDFSEEAEEPNVPYEPSEPLPAAPEAVAAAFPDSAFFTTPVIREPASEPEQSEETVESVSAAGIDVESTEEEESEEESEDEVPVEEPPTDDDKPPVEEPNPDQPLQASVREQNSRYPHRSSRRMRRRGRGGDRDRGGDRNQAEKSGERGAVQTPEREARAPQIEVVDDRKSAALPSITDLLKEGQEIIVQIAKEPLGQKGARITSHIALPGRYVVYMPTVEHMGVSRKIASDEERQRLKRILQLHRQGITGGFIVRTAGEGHTDEEIGADMAYLYNLWLDIRQKAEKKPAPVLLHHDLEIVQRILRDQLSDMYKTIWVDNEDVYESTVRFMQRFQPALVGRVKMYTRSAPVFDFFGITSEIEKALRPKVWLKSGGYIVINQTEALVAVDVNTGKYVGKSNRLEDTITKTNTEAVKEIVRQIRLRDLGGIIVVDFIDMDERKNRQKVMQALEEAMRSDRAPYKILQFNDFGLVAITRKRVKQSLERSLCAPCPTCEGAGYTKSVTTVVGEILQEAVKMRPNVDGKNVVVRTHPDVAKFLKSNSNDYLEELESIVGRPVVVKSDPLLHPEKFDLAV
jgi:ribonuclease G